MKFSLRTLLIVVTAFAVLAVGLSWFRNFAPTSHSNWGHGGVVQESPEGVRYEFDFGGFSANGKPFVGFIVKRVHNEQPLRPSWITSEGGQVYVNGSKILFNSEFQLFFAENDAEPTRVLLNSEGVKRLGALRTSSPDAIEQFWSSLKPEK